MGKKVVIDLAVSNEPVEVEQTAEEISEMETMFKTRIKKYKVK